MAIKNPRDLIIGINSFIKSNESKTIKFNNVKLNRNSFENNYFEIQIIDKIYWLSFEKDRRIDKSFIHLYDENREKSSMIQFTIDSSNFKINNQIFTLKQNRGTTIGRKIKGMKEKFNSRMYELGFNSENIITSEQITDTNYNNVLKDIFFWIEIRLQTKLELENKYRNVENFSNENEAWDEDNFIEDIQTKTEGGKKVIISVNAERNSQLRNKAIKHHGTICMACGFDFNKIYGAWAKNYIEVHHLIPLSDYKRRETNYKTDLSVLCANCHRMVHKKKNSVLSIKQLKKKISNTLKKYKKL